MAVTKKDCLSGMLGSYTIPLVFALLEGLTHFGNWWGDSGSYVSIVKLFRGTANVGEGRWHGLLRPVVPLLAVPLSYLMSYRDAIATVNLGFFLVGTLFTYLFTKKLWSNGLAFISAISFASAAPSLMFGTAILTDGPAYAMQVVLLYFLLFVLEKKADAKTSIMVGILIGVGVLTKETSFTVLIFLILRFILHRDRLKIANVMIVILVGLAIPLAWTQLIDYSYLGFYGEGLAYKGTQPVLAYLGYKGLIINPKIFALSAVYAFNLCLPFAFIAFFGIKDDEFKTLCEILLSVGVLLVVWPTGPESRLTFLTFPAVLPLAAFGMKQASQILATRPWFKFLSQKCWTGLFLLAVVIYSNANTFKLYFRIP